MSDRSLAATDWTALPIICPHCGNHGSAEGDWTKNSHTPFKLIEDVVRSFDFVVEPTTEGTLRLIADVNSDSVDWESGRNMRIECMQCFGDIDLPENADCDFQ